MGLRLRFLHSCRGLRPVMLRLLPTELLRGELCCCCLMLMLRLLLLRPLRLLPVGLVVLLQCRWCSGVDAAAAMSSCCLLLMLQLLPLRLKRYE